MKLHPNPPDDFFAAEADGLAELAAAAEKRLRVPGVIAWNDMMRPAWLLLEWLPHGEERAEAAEQLGRGLAFIHHTTSSDGRYGLDRANFCGLTSQQNGWSDSWPEFFGQQRLGPQLTLAAAQGHMPTERQDKIERLIERLPEWLPTHPPASLLHGDLWRGNWLPLEDGTPALIDPAISFGDREADLAFSRLFGGFPEGFYAAYQETWPLEPGHEERSELLNLYHLLNHLNLFGESYGAAVDRLLARYVG